MPKFKPEQKIGKDQLSVYLPVDRLTTLHGYARFLNDSSVQHLLCQMIDDLDSDREFQKWKAEHVTELNELNKKFLLAESLKKNGRIVTTAPVQISDKPVPVPASATQKGAV